MLTDVLDLVRGGWRYATGLRNFLKTTITFEEAKANLTHQLRNREENFLSVLERGVYERPQSPYYRLLVHAGFSLSDVQALVHDKGLQGALSELHDAGVYVTLDEFKGRAPVRRPGLEFPVSDRDFDNPLLTSHFTGSTSGSRGGGTRVDIDFSSVAHDGESLFCALEANRVADRPVFVWRAAPPSAYGLKLVLRFARLGRMPAKWFASNRLRWNRQGLQGRSLMAYTFLASRLSGRPLPQPEYVKRQPLLNDWRRQRAAVLRRSCSACRARRSASA